jgi:hypothetical protein
MIVDSFSYQTVTASYNGTPCQNIGRALVERAGFEKCKYMTVCIPSYNEDKEELYKTMLSLMQNADFIKKVRTIFFECRLSWSHTLMVSFVFLSLLRSRPDVQIHLLVYPWNKNFKRRY